MVNLARFSSFYNRVAAESQKPWDKIWAQVHNMQLLTSPAEHETFLNQYWIVKKCEKQSKQKNDTI